MPRSMHFFDMGGWSPTPHRDDGDGGNGRSMDDQLRGCPPPRACSRDRRVSAHEGRGRYAPRSGSRRSRGQREEEVERRRKRREQRQRKAEEGFKEKKEKKEEERREVEDQGNEDSRGLVQTHRFGPGSQDEKEVYEEGLEDLSKEEGKGSGDLRLLRGENQLDFDFQQQRSSHEQFGTQEAVPRGSQGAHDCGGVPRGPYHELVDDVPRSNAQQCRATLERRARSGPPDSPPFLQESCPEQVLSGNGPGIRDPMSGIRPDASSSSGRGLRCRGPEIEISRRDGCRATFQCEPAYGASGSGQEYDSYFSRGHRSSSTCPRGREGLGKRIQSSRTWIRARSIWRRLQGGQRKELGQERQRRKRGKDWAGLDGQEKEGLSEERRMEPPEVFEGGRKQRRKDDGMAPQKEKRKSESMVALADISKEGQELDMGGAVKSSTGSVSKNSPPGFSMSEAAENNLLDQGVEEEEQRPKLLGRGGRFEEAVHASRFVALEEKNSQNLTFAALGRDVLHCLERELHCKTLPTAVASSELCTGKEATACTAETVLAFKWWEKAVLLGLKSLAEGPTPNAWSAGDIFENKLAKSVREQLQRFDMWEESVPVFNFDDFFLTKTIDYRGEQVKLGQSLCWEAVRNSLPDGVGCLKLADFCRLGTRHYIDHFEDYLMDTSEMGPIRKPKVMVAEAAWAELSEGLVRKGLCEVCPVSSLFHVGGSPLLNGMFAVGKGEYVNNLESQRLIMNLVPLNSLCGSLEGDVNTLPTLSTMGAFLLEDGEVCLTSSEDIRCFFYLFEVPEKLEALHGLQ